MNWLRKKISIVLFLMAFHGFAQKSDTDSFVNHDLDSDSLVFSSHKYNYMPFGGIGPTIGYRGFGSHYLELGFTTMAFVMGSVGAEISIMSNFNSKDHIAGVSLGAYKGFTYFEIGFSGTIYCDFERSQLYLKPSLGFGLGSFCTINYGYNFSAGKNIFNDKISMHEIRLIVRLPLNLL